MFLLLMTACGVDPAPEDLDGLVHWLWDNHGVTTGADFGDTFTKVRSALDPLDSLITGDLSDLVPDQTYGFNEGDPAQSRGLVIARTFPCTLEALAPILYALDQDAQYPDVYTDYRRTYTSDVGAFADGRSPTLSWEVTASATLLGVAYTEDLLGGLHQVDADAGGPGLMARTWLPGPADFDADGWTWTQDFQIELWLEPTPGTLWHVYGLWRDMDLGGLGMDNDGVASTTLDAMTDWDDQTALLCESFL